MGRDTARQCFLRAATVTAFAPDKPRPFPVDRTMAGPYGSGTKPTPVYGRRGKLPEPEAREYRCFCGKLILRCGGDPRVAIEGYCRECRCHVVFEA